jgi:RNA polymerase sigma-70 factor, ECF subfamily
MGILIARAQDGDRAAFGDLMSAYHTGVINLIYRFCGDTALAEDAAQEAFIRAWQHLSTFRTGSNFRPWLYRIAINAALDMLRREKPTANVDDLQLVSPVDGIEANLEKRERLQRVRQAVLSLPETSRVVLVLREYEGLSYQEIAGVLDIPAGTVMSRLNYARKCLTERLSGQLEEE